MNSSYYVTIMVTNLTHNFEPGNEHYELLLEQFLYPQHSSTLADHLSTMLQVL